MNEIGKVPSNEDTLAHLRLRNEIDLTKELEHLFNRFSVDADCNIHDFVLAEYIVTTLQNLKLLQYTLKKLRSE